MSAIDFIQVSKRICENQIIDQFNLHIPESSFVSLLGPSGCGKSSLVRILAGLDRHTSGEALLDGKPITGPGQDRGMVFQGYSLFPWLTVKKNVMFGPAMNGRGDAEKDALLDRIAALQRTLDKRSLADELAGERALLARDRYLTQRLLQDEHGKPALDLRGPDFAQQWERLPLRVKDAARPAVWTVLGQVRQAPFSWERLRGRKPV
jgi:ABC-type nitrate/sulfonate/bicarbonate transport system ATPase subunit